MILIWFSSVNLLIDVFALILVPQAQMMDFD